MRNGHVLTSSLLVAGAALILSAMLPPQSADADDAVAKGKTVYEGVGACGGCHGISGAGDGPAAAALDPKPRSFVTGNFALDTDGDGKRGTEVDIYNVITNGALKYGGNVMMTGRAEDISEADRHALAKYVLSLKK